MPFNRLHTFSHAEIAARIASPEWPDPDYVASAIARGHVHRIPADALRQVDFSVPRGQNNRNLLHSAAGSGRLDQIPPEVMSEAALTAPSKQWETPLHIAARSGFLYQVPPKLLNERTLTVPNPKGVTALDVAEATGYRDQLPPETASLGAKPIPAKAAKPKSQRKVHAETGELGLDFAGDDDVARPLTEVLAEHEEARPLTDQEVIQQAAASIPAECDSLLGVAKHWKQAMFGREQASPCDAAAERLMNGQMLTAMGELDKAGVPWEVMAPFMPDTDRGAEECEEMYRAHHGKLRGYFRQLEGRERDIDGRLILFAGKDKKGRTCCLWADALDAKKFRVLKSPRWHVSAIDQPFCKWRVHQQPMTKLAGNFATARDAFAAAREVTAVAPEPDADEMDDGVLARIGAPTSDFSSEDAVVAVRAELAREMPVRTRPPLPIPAVGAELTR